MGWAGPTGTNYKRICYSKNKRGGGASDRVWNICC